MFKIYSKGCEYALRLLTQIPLDKADQKFLAVDLCRKAKVPVHSARKILQLLVEHKILAAVSGPGGGYQLKKNPDEITLLGIIKAVDGPKAFNRCVMGLPQCSEHHHCPVHNTWKKIKSEMEKEMNHQTLHQLMTGDSKI